MFKLILGRAGTGKTTAVLSRLTKAGQRRKQVLIVPEQQSHEAERALCRAGGDRVSLYGEVLSFSRLANRVFLAAGGMGEPELDAGGRLLLMHQAVKAVSDQLTVYARPSRRPVFLESLLATADELKSSCVQPELLLQAGRELPGPERELASDYHTLESCNGKEALESIFNKTPDLVISDVMMPEMDGLTLCRKIKQNVNLNHIPVILLTAKTREEDNLEGLETGADAYMTKPFHMEILRKTAANLIRSRERLRNTYTGQQTQGDKVQPIEVQSPDDKLMERIMRVINENLSNPNLTVEMITTEVGISRVHLHRKLKELTNQTTRDFIRNIRLKQAAELLSKKRYTIAEVADLTGFTNPNNFSTAFKDLYGMPPSIYMEQHLKQDKNKEEN